jgi:MFS family permease
MSGAELALAATALLVGMTGTWSPCGFSMIETIGPRGHRGGRPTTVAACAAFALGAPIGGALTFGSLAQLGELAWGAGGRLAYLLAAAIALVAAIAEARGVRIVPQVRRQLPERWRRRLPMPLAAFGYGILLGLGFTTFVLSFGVWALAGISLAVGEPTTGLAVGLAFGVGRAAPICALAPVADRPAGIRAIEAMACHPGLLRGARIGDAAALLLAAVALAASDRATAATTIQDHAADPAAAGESIAFQRGTERAAFLRRGGQGFALAGTDPALGGPWAATIAGDEIVLIHREDLTEIRRVPAPNADAVAISGGWLAWRSRSRGRDHLIARRISPGGRPGKVRRIAGTGKRSQLGRPAIDGAKLAFAKATRRRNSIFLRRLGTGKSRRLVTSPREGISNPALGPKEFVYVRTTRHGDRLKLRKLGRGGEGRTIYARRRARLWSTALRGKRVLVTVLRGNPPRARIVSVGRR